MTRYLQGDAQFELVKMVLQFDFAMVGYKYTDKDTIEASHRCSKCGFILKDAVQTDCGHRYCLSCISPLVSQGSTRCSAVCNSTVVKSKWFRDKIADREVLDLPVHCVNQHLGCPWEGELRHRQAHIENPCPFKRAVVRQARAELFHLFALFSQIFVCNFTYNNEKNDLLSNAKLPSKPLQEVYTISAKMTQRHFKSFILDIVFVML
ncbi:predicted protein [Nematostella vectensis]|uniref:TNF receptor-associated factor 3/5 RING domain-containing protein n=1 Tax=Nematostella vectensis TaxID=45351 RepID=A7SBN3_NEMVE|nr:predicted protein [Nematostella vectensis]|eukprot:XP_001630964.1 predicted protein [Nematostella vectensis]